MAVESVEKAHGNYEHWLWPLHPLENVQAGCQQCHAMDMVVDHAPVLSYGKELFQYRGCVGCHRFQNYDPEPEEIVSVQQQVLLLETQRHDTQRDIQRDIQMGDTAPDNDTARMYYTQADKLRVSISDIDGRLEQLDRRSKDLLRDTKKVGPDLKEVRVKIHPDWIPVWISNPHAWRPGTRMPRFRLADDEVKAIAAFIWQSGIDGTLPQQPPGDPVKGKESFETRGCMGCHSLDESNPGFAANLSRVGEKDNYDYLVRWIHNPRERTRPYCPFEKRDLTEEDYKRHGLPFVFDLDHSKCPNDGHELQVEQETIMPNLRLTLEEARDIASYLMTLKKQEPSSYARADYLNDPHLKAQGHALVQRYGCAGCHEIAGMEDEGRIGTELTKEGSKPIEQIDFALLTAKARQQGWYDHKGFFEHKLEKPEIYDTGRDWKDRDPNERLRMPDFDMKPQEISALTTFLMGAVDSQIPPALLGHAGRPAARHPGRLVGGQEIQLHGLPSVHGGAVEPPDDFGALSNAGVERSVAAQTHGRGRARQSRLDAEIPCQPGDGPQGHGSQRRAALPESSDADLLLLAHRDSQARTLLPGAGGPAHALHPAQARSAERPGNRHGAGAVHQQSRALPEVSCHGRPHARQVCHRAELPPGARPAEARMGAALDARSFHDQPRHRHAFRPVQTGRRPLRFRRSHARHLQGL